MDIDTDDAQRRFYNVGVKYGNAIRDHGYGDAITKNLEVAIQQICERVRPRHFQDHMEGILRIEKHGGFHKKEFGAYVRRLAEEAEKYEYVHNNQGDVIKDSILPISQHNSTPSRKRKRDSEDDSRNVKPKR